MSFLNDAINLFGDNDRLTEYRITVFGDRAVYIEGVKSIKSYSQNKMEIFVKKGEIKIIGEGLYIKKYCAEDLAVCGKIKAFSKD